MSVAFAKPRWFAWLMVLGLTGCAAITNPVADGIPARRLPPEFLACPKSEEIELPLTVLRQKPPDVYRVGPGDVLGLHIEGVLGERGQLPPVRLPEGNSGLPPAAGVPIMVRADGTLPVPYVDPVRVEGLSLNEVQAALVKAYTVDKQILQPGRERILVSLYQPRTTRVLVLRQDAGGVAVGQGGVLTNSARGTGTAVDLPAYQNDVLTALTLTGGLPGGDARNEVVIQRGYYQTAADLDALVKRMEKGKLPAPLPPGNAELGQVLRIPLRLKPGEGLPFRPEDVVLKTGDIVFVDNRETEVFYTGGILFPQQFPLPRDYDLDVVGAIVLAGGPLVNGLISQNNLSGQIVPTGIGNPNPSLVTVLRRTKGYGQIRIKVDLNRALRDPRENIILQAGDVVILQETMGEAIARYVTNVFRVNMFSTWIRRRDLLTTGNLNVP